MDDKSKISVVVSAIASACIKTFVDVRADVPSKALQCARRELDILREKGAGREIDVLLRAGCKELPLALTAVVGVKAANELQSRLQSLCKMFGNRKGLISITESLPEELETAALLFEALPLEELPLEEELPVEGVLPGSTSEQFFRQGALAPLFLFKFLADALRMITKQMTNRCVRERYPLCAYVKSATGDCHDPEVAVIISRVTGEELYENALCVWRTRQFKKIIGWPFEFQWRFAQMLEEEHYKNRQI